MWQASLQVLWSSPSRLVLLEKIQGAPLMNSLPPSLFGHSVHPLENASVPRHGKKLSSRRRIRVDFSHRSRRSQTRFIDSIIRLLELSNSNSYGLKQIGYIFDMDTSLLDRRFREAKGITLKAYIDGVLKERLIIMLDKGQRYGCTSSKSSGHFGLDIKRWFFG